MADVIVEHNFTSPFDVDIGPVPGPAEGGFPVNPCPDQSCFDNYRVHLEEVFLATDGLRLLSHLSAPDAESARIALRHQGVESGFLWAATVHAAPDPGMANVIAESRFDRPISTKALESLEARGNRFLVAHRVKAVRRYLSLNRKRAIFLYQAPDTDSVSEAWTSMGIHLDRVWTFRHPKSCPLTGLREVRDRTAITMLSR